MFTKNQNILMGILTTIALCFAKAGSADTTQITLSDLEMRQTIGGIEINSFALPTNNTTYYTDNIPVEALIKNYALSEPDFILEANVNGSKEAAYFVSTVMNASQAWRDGRHEKRLNWPLNLNTPSSLDLTFCDASLNNCGTEPGGPHSKTGLVFDDGVIVGKIWFHNTTDGNEETSVTASKAQALVDNIDNTYRHDTIQHPSLPGLILATNSVDAILEQCANDKRFQFRYHALNTYTTGSIRNFGNGTYPDLYLSSGFKSYVKSIDPNLEYFHVFFVKQIGIDRNNDNVADFFPDGVTSNEDGLAINFALIQEGLSDFNMASVLTHEMLHSLASHDGFRYYESNCHDEQPTTQISLSMQHVMCHEFRYAGRTMGSGICNNLYDNNTPFDMGGGTTKIGIRNFN